MPEITLVHDGLYFAEAPRWRDDRLFFSDFYAHTVHTTDARGTLRTVCSVPQQPSGLGFDPNGALLIVSMNDRRLLRFDGHGLEVVADLGELSPYACNDMLVDEQGRAYVGNFGWDPRVDRRVRATSLLRVSSGQVSVAAQDVVFPNGMVTTADGRTLLLAETFASRISAFDVDADGMLTNRRIWACFAPEPCDSIVQAIASRYVLPDGMALDAEGAVWIGDAVGNAALRVAPGGRVLSRVATGDLAVYAVALGGPDRRTLFMCAAPPLGRGRPETDKKGVLLAARVEVPGAGLP